jgi:flagellar hook-associated protein 3 FlgL
MNENLERLTALQEKTASTKAFQRASDDPASAAAALGLRSSLESSQAYLDTATLASSWMSATDFSLKQTADLGTRAINLALRGVSDTMGAEERQALAGEMDELLHQAIGLGNTSHAGNYIYAGFRTNTKPFEGLDADADGRFEGVQNLNNSGEAILRTIGPGHTISQNIDGIATFSPLFDALIAARDALAGADPTIPEDARSADIQSKVDALRAAVEGVSTASTTNGARHKQVKQVTERLEKTQLELKSLLSQKEDVNMAEAIVELRRQETVYQSVLEVSSRAISAMSLFDMLS